MAGYIYAVTNKYIPGLVKIGYTKDLDQRIKSLSNSSVPEKFNCLCSAYVNNPTMAERRLHRLLVALGISKKREFFKVDDSIVLNLFEIIGMSKGMEVGKKPQKTTRRKRRSKHGSIHPKYLDTTWSPPPNYNEVHKRWIIEKGYIYYPGHPSKHDTHNEPIVSHKEGRVYISVLEFSIAHHMPTGFVREKLNSPCGWLPHEIIQLWAEQGAAWGSELDKAIYNKNIKKV